MLPELFPIAHVYRISQSFPRCFKKCGDFNGFFQSDRVLKSEIPGPLRKGECRCLKALTRFLLNGMGSNLCGRFSVSTLLLTLFLILFVTIC